MPSEKIFRDPVHGYIKVPKCFCHELIDTPLFQRLREIEQTGMRILYPAARHNRFSHSLGVFHLGSLAFDSFKDNSASSFPDDVDWDSLRNTFLVACLLHDCAHAPFSHTFENNYDLEKGDNSLSMRIGREAKCGELKHDLSLDVFGPAAHEKASSLLLLRTFKTALERLNTDPVLAVRMIMGLKYTSEDPTKKLCNCLISLLNGNAIDVDKLDYIVRDTWASGVNNVQIDTERLISSLTVAPVDLGKVAYKKSALSVIQSVIDGRNFLHRWVFNHHKVSYHQYLLKTAVNHLAKAISTSEDSGPGLKKLFSVESLESAVDIGNGIQLYLPTDGDIMFLCKKFLSEDPYVGELLFRNHLRFPLWKTRAEFEIKFPGKDSSTRDVMFSEGPDKLKEKFGDGGISDSFVACEASRGVKELRKNDVLIHINGECRAYSCEEFGSRGCGSQEDTGKFSYIFAPKRLYDQRIEMLNFLNSIF